jgi:hypothetical protein
MAGARVAAAPRVPMLPSRDHRGRFVSFPTTNAPSWYVFCADRYRIPGQAEVVPLSATERPAPQPIPSAKVVRRRRRSVQRDQVVNWLVILLFLVVVGWYAFSLPAPQR